MRRATPPGNYSPSFLPTYLPTYLPSHVITYLPGYLPTWLPTYLPTYLPPYLYLPTYHTFMLSWIRSASTVIPIYGVEAVLALAQDCFFTTILDLIKSTIFDSDFLRESEPSESGSGHYGSCRGTSLIKRHPPRTIIGV